jgi:hypothetical protein
VVPTVLPQVYFNLQQSTQHPLIKGKHLFAAVIKGTLFRSGGVSLLKVSGLV